MSEELVKFPIVLGGPSENSIVSEIEIVMSWKSKNQFRISMEVSHDILKAS
jgi:hypothetical protein